MARSANTHCNPRQAALIFDNYEIWLMRFKLIIENRNMKKTAYILLLLLITPLLAYATRGHYKIDNTHSSYPLVLTVQKKEQGQIYYQDGKVHEHNHKLHTGDTRIIPAGTMSKEIHITTSNGFSHISIVVSREDGQEACNFKLWARNRGSFGVSMPTNNLAGCNQYLIARHNEFFINHIKDNS